MWRTNYMSTFFSMVIKFLSLKACKRRHYRKFTVDIKESPSVHCEPLPQFSVRVKRQLEDLICNCPECCKVAQAPRQPLISTPLVQHPWEKVASDLLEVGGRLLLEIC